MPQDSSNPGALQRNVIPRNPSISDGRLPDSCTGNAAIGHGNLFETQQSAISVLLTRFREDCVNLTVKSWTDTFRGSAVRFRSSPSLLLILRKKRDRTGSASQASRLRKVQHKVLVRVIRRACFRSSRRSVDLTTNASAMEKSGSFL